MNYRKSYIFSYNMHLKKYRAPHASAILSCRTSILGILGLRIRTMEEILRTNAHSKHSLFYQPLPISRFEAAAQNRVAVKPYEALLAPNASAKRHISANKKQPIEHVITSNTQTISPISSTTNWSDTQTISSLSSISSTDRFSTLSSLSMTSDESDWSLPSQSSDSLCQEAEELTTTALPGTNAVSGRYHYDPIQQRLVLIDLLDASVVLDDFLELTLQEIDDIERQLDFLRLDFNELWEDQDNACQYQDEEWLQKVNILLESTEKLIQQATGIMQKIGTGIMEEAKQQLIAYIKQNLVKAEEMYGYLQLMLSDYLAKSKQSLQFSSSTTANDLPSNPSLTQLKFSVIDKKDDSIF